MIVELNGEQNTEWWDEQRLGIITSSVQNAVNAKGKDGTSNSSAMYNNLIAQKALERIFKRKLDTFKSLSMQQGNETEATAAFLYEVITGTKLRKCGFLKNEEENTGSSPDRLTVDGTGIVQFKCPEPTEHLKILETKKIPPVYWLQCVDELRQSEREWHDFVSYNGDFPDDSQIVIIRTYRNDVEEEMAKIAERVRIINEKIDQKVKFITNYKA